MDSIRWALAALVVCGCDKIEGPVKVTAEPASSAQVREVPFGIAVDVTSRVDIENLKLEVFMVDNDGRVVHTRQPPADERELEVMQGVSASSVEPFVCKGDGWSTIRFNVTAKHLGEAEAYEDVTSVVVECVEAGELDPGQDSDGGGSGNQGSETQCLHTAEGCQLPTGDCKGAPNCAEWGFLDLTNVKIDDCGPPMKVVAKVAEPMPKEVPSATEAILELTGQPGAEQLSAEIKARMPSAGGMWTNADPKDGDHVTVEGDTITFHVTKETLDKLGGKPAEMQVIMYGYKSGEKLNKTIKFKDPCD